MKRLPRIAAARRMKPTTTTSSQDRRAFLDGASPCSTAGDSLLLPVPGLTASLFLIDADPFLLRPVIRSQFCQRMFASAHEFDEEAQASTNRTLISTTPARDWDRPRTGAGTRCPGRARSSNSSAPVTGDRPAASGRA